VKTSKPSKICVSFFRTLFKTNRGKEMEGERKKEGRQAEAKTAYC
jgi:hypothetical protein